MGHEDIAGRKRTVGNEKRSRHIEAMKNPKLNGGPRPVGHIGRSGGWLSSPVLRFMYVYTYIYIVICMFMCQQLISYFGVVGVVNQGHCEPVHTSGQSSYFAFDNYYKWGVFPMASENIPKASILELEFSGHFSHFRSRFIGGAYHILEVS